MTSFLSSLRKKMDHCKLPIRFTDSWIHSIPWLFHVFHSPKVPLAGTLLGIFYVLGHVPSECFRPSGTSASLLPWVSLWACPWPVPMSLLHLGSRSLWTDFLPRGCSRETWLMKSTEIEQFLQRLTLMALESWGTQMCQQNNSPVAHRWKTDVGSRQLFLVLVLLLWASWWRRW